MQIYQVVHSKNCLSSIGEFCLKTIAKHGTCSFGDRDVDNDEVEGLSDNGDNEAILPGPLPGVVPPFLTLQTSKLLNFSANSSNFSCLKFLSKTF